ncbi:tRNA-splicing endonuclease positive effector-related, putative [Ichthyophthirius multifiliis]|uniref:tRNA-splicing endonuclease positive effector-related, putative n=1 Tax=Ichthyophthirius multifiliis TaxID=5932 RepID=G0R347_ICHMU|nr:tRNA-splicing endonuclease positive effector-related, putative [Ichthyophthirius multifiliis]EGR28123.1 tRNA-splicing endonuclease positive effector-related, putative [Ichthyophthirius multifiliis]|eukprot:XP_004027468.1 tRNA-splicing endonuclease positive effector-related, putative [Ichthyophthirius multifiliis]
MILIGDNKQLQATTFGKNQLYKRSLFERISQNQIEPYFLNKQYRMQPYLSLFPSQIFYKGNLKDSKKVQKRPFLFKSFLNENYSHFFIDIQFSKEIQNKSSFFNLEEAYLCISLVSEIISLLEKNQFPSNNLTIGVIAPYSQQVQCLKNLFRQQNWYLIYRKIIKIKTIDSFQGQEKDIIIFSTVRTSRIGFLQDEKRLNVALTRAKYCLYVVGNSNCLNKDFFWDSFIGFMSEQGKYGQILEKDNLLSNTGALILQGLISKGIRSLYKKKNKDKSIIQQGDQNQDQVITNNQDKKSGISLVDALSYYEIHNFTLCDLKQLIN